jgi:hypothetical protein
MYALEEAVARFFPAGAGYDHNQAKRLIRWLDSCGYAVVAKDEASAADRVAQSAVKPLRDCLRVSTVEFGHRKSA